MNPENWRLWQWVALVGVLFAGWAGAISDSLAVAGAVYTVALAAALFLSQRDK